MGLTSCACCSAEVSDSAAHCPQCQIPNPWDADSRAQAERLFGDFQSVKQTDAELVALAGPCPDCHRSLTAEHIRAWKHHSKLVCPACGRQFQIPCYKCSNGETVGSFWLNVRWVFFCRSHEPSACHGCGYVHEYNNTVCWWLRIGSEITRVRQLLQTYKTKEEKDRLEQWGIEPYWGYLAPDLTLAVADIRRAHQTEWRQRIAKEQSVFSLQSCVESLRHKSGAGWSEILGFAQQRLLESEEATQVNLTAMQRPLITGTDVRKAALGVGITLAVTAQTVFGGALVGLVLAVFLGWTWFWIAVCAGLVIGLYIGFIGSST